jgi:hypothetical protein
MGHISELKDVSVTEEIANREIFDNYKKAKGKHDFDTFLKNLKKFYELTLANYVGDGPDSDDEPQSREEAYGLWVSYIKSPKEANRYFRAVDDFSAYS